MSSETVPIVSVRQVKAARALLGWSQEDLAAAADIGLGTLKRLEAGDGNAEMGGRAKTAEAITRALITAGVVFISPAEASSEGGAGVRLTGRD